MRNVAIIAASRLVRQTLQGQLDRIGGLVTTATLDGSGPLGPALVVAEPDLVVIDGLPAESAAERVRHAAGGVPGATIVVLTSARDSDWIDHLVEAGADILLARNLDPVTIAMTIGHLATGAIIHTGSTRRASRPEDTLGPLTARELEILRFVADGRRNQQIAEALTVTPQTVKFHLTNIYRKLNVSSRTEASRYAYVNGLVDDGASAAAIA